MSLPTHDDERVRHAPLRASSPALSSSSKTPSEPLTNCSDVSSLDDYELLDDFDHSGTDSSDMPWPDPSNAEEGIGRLGESTYTFVSEPSVSDGDPTMSTEYRTSQDRLCESIATADSDDGTQGASTSANLTSSVPIQSSDAFGPGEKVKDPDHDLVLPDPNNSFEVGDTNSQLGDNREDDGPEDRDAKADFESQQAEVDEILALVDTKNKSVLRGKLAELDSEKSLTRLYGFFFRGLAFLTVFASFIYFLSIPHTNPLPHHHTPLTNKLSVDTHRAPSVALSACQQDSCRVDVVRKLAHANHTASRSFQKSAIGKSTSYSLSVIPNVSTDVAVYRFFDRPNLSSCLVASAPTALMSKWANQSRHRPSLQCRLSTVTKVWLDWVVELSATLQKMAASAFDVVLQEHTNFRSDIVEMVYVSAENARKRFIHAAKVAAQGSQQLPELARHHYEVFKSLAASETKTALTEGKKSLSLMTEPIGKAIAKYHSGRHPVSRRVIRNARKSRKKFMKGYDKLTHDLQTLTADTMKSRTSLWTKGVINNFKRDARCGAVFNSQKKKIAKQRGGKRGSAGAIKNKYGKGRRRAK